METKFHISKNGTPGKCTAQEGNCPLGESSPHFDSVEEAQIYADNQNEAIEASKESFTDSNKATTENRIESTVVAEIESLDKGDDGTELFEKVAQQNKFDSIEEMLGEGETYLVVGDDEDGGIEYPDYPDVNTIDLYYKETAYRFKYDEDYGTLDFKGKY